MPRNLRFVNRLVFNMTLFHCLIKIIRLTVVPSEDKIICLTVVPVGLFCKCKTDLMSHHHDVSNLGTPRL